MKLTFDNRENNLNFDSEIANISLSNIKIYLDKLDGKKVTLITLERTEGSILSIGGGNNENYIVTLFKNALNFTLYNKSFPKLDIELCVGGQYADFPSEIVISKSMAEKVIDLFFMNLELELNFIEE